MPCRIEQRRPTPRHFSANAPGVPTHPGWGGAESFGRTQAERQRRAAQPFALQQPFEGPPVLLPEEEAKRDQARALAAKAEAAAEADARARWRVRVAAGERDRAEARARQKRRDEAFSERMDLRRELREAGLL